MNNRTIISKISFSSIIVLIFVSLSANAIAQRVYMNDTTEYTVNLVSPRLFKLSTNLTINDNINHSFEMKLGTSSNSQHRIQYVAGNLTGFLLSLLIKSTTSDDEIEKYECDGSLSTNPDVCTGGCGGNNFDNYNSYSVVFNPSASNAEIFVNGVQQGTAVLCMNFTEIGKINFTGIASSSNIKNNLVTANNKPPVFIGSLPNITWSEDTSTDFNISGNFSDPNNDTLTFTYTDVNNISISINNNTGIVNLTPDNGFFGIRYVKFIANDGDNTTFSNNVTLNVTAVNDAPSITSVTIGNSDFLNRTNGSLTASWTFSDADNNVMSGNETLWYINSVENESLRNLTVISSSNTTKNQNWSFSVRVFDGTNFSSFVTSENLTIDNALQSFNPALGVESAEANVLFVYDINYTDIDNDTITFLDNSSLFAITNEGIINFTPAISGNITVNITLREDSDVSGILTIEVKDTIAPVITAISASSSGTATVTVTLSATTDEAAECRFATLNINYADMGIMSATNSTSHSNSQSFTSDASGTYYVRCNDTAGNVMGFSNSTAFSAVIAEETSATTTADSPSNGGGGGWQCRYDWKCRKWSECTNGKKTRDCEVVKVEPFYSETKCAYMGRIDTEEECEMPEKEEQKPAEKPEGEKGELEKRDEKGMAAVTGRAILDLAGNLKNLKLRHGFIILSIVIVALSMFSYYRYFNKPPENLSEEEKIRLQKMLEKIDKIN